MADDRPVDAKAPPAEPPIPKLPKTESWTKTELKSAGVSFLVPAGASVDPETSAKGYFNVKMPSGYEVRFSANNPPDFKEKTRWYKEDASGFDGLIFAEPDALVAARREGPPAGEYWETSACSKEIDGKPMCAMSVGALIGMDNEVTKLTHDEAMAVVAIARSIEALK